MGRLWSAQLNDRINEGITEGSWEEREEEQPGVEVGVVQIRSMYVPDGQMF